MDSYAREDVGPILFLIIATVNDEDGVFSGYGVLKGKADQK